MGLIGKAGWESGGNWEIAGCLLSGRSEFKSCFYLSYLVQVMPPH